MGRWFWWWSCSPIYLQKWFKWLRFFVKNLYINFLRTTIIYSRCTAIFHKIVTKFVRSCVQNYFALNPLEKEKKRKESQSTFKTFLNFPSRLGFGVEDYKYFGTYTHSERCWWPRMQLNLESNYMLVWFIILDGADCWGRCRPAGNALT